MNEELVDEMVEVVTDELATATGPDEMSLEDAIGIYRGVKSWCEGMIEACVVDAEKGLD